MALFFLVIPMIFDTIDSRSKERVRKDKSPWMKLQSTTTATTTKKKN
jgi:hypothetical protein